MRFTEVQENHMNLLSLLKGHLPLVREVAYLSNSPVVWKESRLVFCICIILF